MIPIAFKSAAMRKGPHLMSRVIDSWISCGFCRDLERIGLLARFMIGDGARNRNSQCRAVLAPGQGLVHSQHGDLRPFRGLHGLSSKGLARPSDTDGVHIPAILAGG